MGGKGGGGGKKGGSPPPPDFGKAAQQTSMSSRPNWSGPTGGQQWSYDPKTGQPTMTQTSPYQGTFDVLKGATEKAAGMDPTQARDQAINQNMDFGMSRLNPMFAQQNNAFESKMANSGMDPGTAGYNAANQNKSFGQSDMYGKMFTDALNQGNETQRTQMAQQMVPFQQLGGLTSAAMAHPYMGQGADLTGAAENQYTAANRQASQGKGKGSTLGTLGSIGGTVFGGPLGGALGGAAGSALGGGGGGKKGGSGGAPAPYTGSWPTEL